MGTETLEVTLDPARGAEITRVRRPGGPNALALYDWRSPRSAQGPAGYGSSQLDWLSGYRGGWQELFPNTGDACEVDGVPMAFHGDVSLAPWEVVSVDDVSCTLRCAARLPLVLERHMRLADGAAALMLEEVVTNESDLDIAFLWGHHPVFPATPGARIDLPGCMIEAEPATASDLDALPAPWPMLADASGVSRDMSVVPGDSLERLLYASDLADGWVALRQPPELPSVAMSWDRATFGCLWIWLQRHAPGFPHYGRAEMLGLEPHSAFPFDGLAAARARGRAQTIEGMAVQHSWLTLVLLDGADEPVGGVGRDGTITPKRRA